MMKSIEVEINNCIKVLKSGGVILYPTDTIWGIGCDATNDDAIKKIYKIKNREESKAMITLLANKKSLYQYVKEVPKKIEEILKESIVPTTVIYNNPMKLSKLLLAKDKSAAIRITKDMFCQKLIFKLQKPIVSTSANISKKTHPKHFSDIESSILSSVDYIVNLRQNEYMETESSIIKIDKKGILEIIR